MKLVKMIHFLNINDLIQRTGFPETTHLSDFHILRMGDSGEHFVKMMPPHSQDFFQVGFQQIMLKTAFSLQTQQFSALKNLLYFVAPHQVMSWVVEQQNEGFIVYFKRDFLSIFPKTIEDEFPFFKIVETSLFELESADSGLILSDLEKIRTVFETPSQHQKSILQGLLLALLYRCKEIYEAQKLDNKNLPTNQILVQKFQAYVQKFYLKKRKIEDYATLLNVTPNYLSTVVKETTNRNAKAFINERLLMEAKNLLTYTEQDISEIAYQLQFDEMTHFGRFFKKETNKSPSEWRKENIKS
jgi:AraC family transcriptional regulator, transcriptional activator of pobA